MWGDGLSCFDGAQPTPKPKKQNGQFEKEKIGRDVEINRENSVLRNSEFLPKSFISLKDFNDGLQKKVESDTQFSENLTTGHNTIDKFSNKVTAISKHADLKPTTDFSFANEKFSTNEVIASNEISLTNEIYSSKGILSTESNVKPTNNISLNSPATDSFKGDEVGSKNDHQTASQSVTGMTSVSVSEKKSSPCEPNPCPGFGSCSVSGDMFQCGSCPPGQKVMMFFTSKYLGLIESMLTQ